MFESPNQERKARRIVPVTVGLVSAACEQNQPNLRWDEETLGHEFLIQQASTVNVNAATQLLTVTLVAIQDTSQRLRDALSQEISLVQQAMEWGEATPTQHWDQLVAVRGTLSDLKHNLRVLLGYMEYAEKLATIVAEISYLSGNIAASDAICERIAHATRACRNQEQLTHDLQIISLELQQRVIVNTPELQEKIVSDDTASEADQSSPSNSDNVKQKTKKGI
ncbi:hypothetical protein EVAR_32360_1 [Eumeta japonica]|uniref:Diablo homolog, mitochondrial n=1 Tax=Eumeta variegata TaxID=151549 RepID=A0A4C1VLV6_EUMVA|nr:hypothetical protein EVAR_32360_1 [Eumeta japonica]